MEPSGLSDRSYLTWLHLEGPSVIYVVFGTNNRMDGLPENNVRLVACVKDIASVDRLIAFLNFFLK